MQQMVQAFFATSDKPLPWFVSVLLLVLGVILIRNRKQGFLSANGKAGLFIGGILTLYLGLACLFLLCLHGTEGIAHLPDPGSAWLLVLGVPAVLAFIFDASIHEREGIRYRSL